MEEIEEAMASVVRMDVIPISGLVMSKLCRIENEAKSVLDLWEPTSYAKLEEEVRTPIENAVLIFFSFLFDFPVYYNFSLSLFNRFIYHY